MWYNNLQFGDNCSLQLESMEMSQIITIITTNVISILLALSAWVCVGMIIYAGYTLITSAGDAAKVAKGKKTVTGAVIGLIISLLGYAIVNFVIEKIFL